MMSRLTKTFGAPKAPPVFNPHGYKAYNRTLEEQYLQMLLTNVMGNTFYQTEKQLVDGSLALHDEMLAKDPEYAARALIFARNKGLMRDQVSIGMAKLSKVRPDLFKAIFDDTALIPPDVMGMMTYLGSENRGQGGRGIKRRIEAWLNDHLSEYWVMKYAGQGRGYSLGDIIYLTHARPKDERMSKLFAYARGKKKLVFDKESQLYWYERLKRAQTDAERIECITQGRLPHEEVISVVGSPSKAVWNAIVRQMPIFALLHNLESLTRHGVLEDNKDYIKSVFTDPERIRKSRILPFRFLAAFDKVSSGWVRDILREAVELSFENIPPLGGRVLLALDRSGSMNQQDLRTGGILGFALFKKSEDAIFKLFDEVLEDAKASKFDSILTQADRVSRMARGWTDTGAALKECLDKGIKVDVHIIITDGQQNRGRLFHDVVSDYRKKVNPDLKVFVVDISPEKNAMNPVAERNTYYIYGWSADTLPYISTTGNLNSSQVAEVKRIPLGEKAS